jgi:hypothetical protein
MTSNCKALSSNPSITKNKLKIKKLAILEKQIPGKILASIFGPNS